MSRRFNPQIPFFHFAILLFTLLLIAYMVFLICLYTLSPQTSPPPDSTISPTYLTNLSHSNAIAFAQSQVAAYTSNIINSVTNHIPTYPNPSPLASLSLPPSPRTTPNITPLPHPSPQQQSLQHPQ